MSAQALSVLVAPDRLKGSLDAATVARSLLGGMRDVLDDEKGSLAPIADGGEGTVNCAVAAGYEPVPDLERCMARAADLLRTAGRQLAPRLGRLQPDVHLDELINERNLRRNHAATDRTPHVSRDLRVRRRLQRPRHRS